MKKVSYLKDHSKNVEINNVLYLERIAMRKNVMKFGAFMILVAMMAMGIMYAILMAIPATVNHIMGG